MTILIAPELYPEFQAILKAVVKRQKLDFKTIEPYLDVYFPAVTSGHARVYGPLIYLAVYHRHDSLLKQLLQLENYDPNVNDVGLSSSLMWLASTQLINSPGEKIPRGQIITQLLNCKKIEASAGRLLCGESALQHLVIKGDQYLDWVQRFIPIEGNLSQDLYGANPLQLSIQEGQIATALEILKTAEGRALASQPRADDIYPLDVVCEHVTDVEGGKKILTALLKEVDPNICYGHTPSLYNILANENPQCILEFSKILLSHGADPNLPGRFNESLISCVVSEYLQALQNRSTPKAACLKELILSLLQHHANIFHTLHQRNISLIEYLYAEPLGMIVINLFKQHFNSDETTLRRIDEISKKAPCASSTSSRSTPNTAATLREELTRIARITDDVKKQNAMFEFHEKHERHFRKGEADYIPAENTAITTFAHMVLRGALLPENILKLIKILKAKDKEYDQYQTIFYKEYLTGAILSIISSPDKPSVLTKLFPNLLYFSQSLDFSETEKGSTSLKVLNDLAQRCVRLALIYAKESHHYFSEFLNIIQQMDASLFDQESKLLILQLEITHAYFTKNRQSFEELYTKIAAVLPKNHILFRQYNHWKTELLASENSKKVLHYDQAQENNTTKKLKEKTTEPPPTMAIVPAAATQNLSVVIMPPAPETHLPIHSKIETNHNNSSSNSHDSTTATNYLIINQALPFFNANCKSYTEDRHISTPQDKTNSRGAALINLERSLDPSTAPIRYNKAVIRKIFRNALLADDEPIKSIVCLGVENICWIVCRIPEEVKQHYGLEKRFLDLFDNATHLLPPTSTGICYEEKKYRMMLGRKDFRLHCHSVIRAKGERCFLVIFNELWRHEEDFAYHPDRYIEDFSEPKTQVQNNNNMMKKYSRN